MVLEDIHKKHFVIPCGWGPAVMIANLQTRTAIKGTTPNCSSFLSLLLFQDPETWAGKNKIVVGIEAETGTKPCFWNSMWVENYNSNRFARSHQPFSQPAKQELAIRVILKNLYNISKIALNGTGAGGGQGGCRGG